MTFWERLQEELHKRNADGIAFAISNAQVVSLESDGLTIGFSTEQIVMRNACCQPAVVKILRDSLQSLTGAQCGIRVKLLPPTKDPLEAEFIEG